MPDRGALDLSRIRAAQSARLRHLAFKATGLFQPGAECRRRGSQKPLMSWSGPLFAIGSRTMASAVSACRRVSRVRRQISSALIVLKKTRRIRKRSGGLFSRRKTAALSQQFPLSLICGMGHPEAVFAQDILIFVRTVLAAPVRCPATVCEANRERECGRCRRKAATVRPLSAMHGIACRSTQPWLNLGDGA